MATEGTSVPGAAPLSELAASLPPADQAPIPAAWKPLQTELATYYRALAQLLEEGAGGRFVVVRGEHLCHTWDSYRDALQYGRDRFGEQQFMVHRVDARDVERLARFFPAKDAVCPG